jgi:hypothetical protein
LLAPLESELDDVLLPMSANVNDAGTGWSVKDMFAANERIVGRKFTYDGNPHTFGDGYVGRAVQRLGSGPPAGVGTIGSGKGVGVGAGAGGKMNGTAAAVAAPVQPPPVVPQQPPFKFDMDAVVAAMALPGAS